MVIRQKLSYVGSQIGSYFLKEKKLKDAFLICVSHETFLNNGRTFIRLEDFSGTFFWARK